MLLRNPGEQTTAVHKRAFHSPKEIHKGLFMELWCGVFSVFRPVGSTHGSYNRKGRGEQTQEVERKETSPRTQNQPQTQKAQPTNRRRKHSNHDIAKQARPENSFLKFEHDPTAAYESHIGTTKWCSSPSPAEVTFSQAFCPTTILGSRPSSLRSNPSKPP
jgi:hypothetical protein